MFVHKIRVYQCCWGNTLRLSFVGEASKQIHEYKLKLQKAEQDITNLDGTVSADNRGEGGGGNKGA